jgi:hypothetical protein
MLIGVLHRHLPPAICVIVCANICKRLRGTVAVCGEALRNPKSRQKLRKNG